MWIEDMRRVGAAALLAAALLAVAILAGACGKMSIYQVAPVEDLSLTSTGVVEQSKDSVPLSGEVYRSINPFIYNGGQASAVSLYSRAMAPVTGGDSSDQERARSELVWAMMNCGDYNVAAHLSRILGAKVTFDVTTGSMIIATAGAASLATGAPAAALSVTAAGLKGLESLVDEKVYQNHVVPLLIKSINAERVRRRAEIEAGLAKSLKDYPVERGIGEARDYAETGSFYRGLALLQKDADTGTNQKERPVEEKRTAELQTSANIEKAKESLTRALADVVGKHAQKLMNGESVSPAEIQEAIKAFNEAKDVNSRPSK